MRIAFALSLVLWAVFGWPASAWQSFRARRRLRGHRAQLSSLSLERIA
jgi:hypothetical protein